jgi:hypothetical protein
MISMRRIALPIILLAALGCGSKPTLVGTWTIPVESVPDLVATLTDDKVAQLSGTYQSVKVQATGSWELKENDLTVRLDKIEVPSELRELVGVMFKSEIEKLKTPVTMKIEWVNDDEVKVTPPSGVSELFNKPFTMRRQVASK